LFQLVFGGDGVGYERDRLEIRGVLAVTEERAELSATIWCFRNWSSGGGYGVWYCVSCKVIGTEWWRWRYFLPFSTWVPTGAADLAIVFGVLGFGVFMQLKICGLWLWLCWCFGGFAGDYGGSVATDLFWCAPVTLAVVFWRRRSAVDCCLCLILCQWFQHYGGFWFLQWCWWNGWCSDNGFGCGLRLLYGFGCGGF
jgi:hypothetical protein